MLTTEKHNKITIYTLDDVSQQTIDAWYEDYMMLLQECPHQECFYVLMDVSHPSIGLTPYLREKASQLINEHGHRQGYMAMVLESVWYTQLVRLFFVSHRRKVLRVNYFLNREEAMAWLNAC
jgi:hypothetical protein